MATLNHMRIGTVARKCGVSIDTIRYYEREGLLLPPQRRASGYREYDEEALDRLRFIRRAKDLGFSLDDIRELLSLSGDREHGVKGVKQRAQRRLALVDERLVQLQRMRDGLEELIANCPGHGALGKCPILRALSEPESDEEAKA
ncbi:MAG TPA: heavy metal-responsive transcriptional regulator [Rhodanobacteraceae bacterium]|nr:heavy metal-responsive transcriptional regulator [Rhodanobacteraceae bacterium]